MPPSKDSPTTESGSTIPKIAIKGFSLSSKSSGAKAGAKINLSSKPALKSNLGKRPRSTFAHGEDSDDDDRAVRHEAVTAFGENGAVRERESVRQGPLVIEGLRNTRITPGGNGTERREGERRRGAGMKNLLPAEVIAARERAANGSVEDKIGEAQVEKEVLDPVKKEVKWGLDVSVRERVKVEDSSAPESADTNTTETQLEDKPVQENEKPKTADEEALAALLGQETKKKGPDLVIESISTNERAAPVSEEDAYRRAIESAPEVSTLEDYERVPVEEFGAALLRGMGWKGEKNGGAKTKNGENRWEVKRRQNLLGLGAKELKGAEELGAWVQKSDVKRLKPASSGADKGGYRGQGEKVRVSDYKREEEKRRERREERGGGSYRSERDRERGYERRDHDRRR